MEITISSDVFGLSSTKHLCRNAVLHPGNDVVMMWWLCHLISRWGVGLNASNLTQRSDLITRIASNLCRACQKCPCTVRSIIGLRHQLYFTCPPRPHTLLSSHYRQTFWIDVVSIHVLGICHQDMWKKSMGLSCLLNFCYFSTHFQH